MEKRLDKKEDNLGLLEREVSLGKVTRNSMGNKDCVVRFVSSIGKSC